MTTKMMRHMSTILAGSSSNVNLTITPAVTMIRISAAVIITVQRLGLSETGYLLLVTKWNEWIHLPKVVLVLLPIFLLFLG